MNQTVGVERNAIKHSDPLLWISLFLLVFDRLWGVVYAHTVFQKPVVIYISFVLLFVLFIGIGVKYGFGKRTKLSTVWLPYLIITILGYLVQLRVQDMTYWFVCLIMILVAAKTPFNKEAPFKLIFWSGVFCSVGILFEMLFPAVYFSNVDPIFVHNIDNFAEITMENVGFAGFTYQLDTTARPIIMAEMVLLCLREKLFDKQLRNNVVYYVIVGLMIGFVLLAGKRTYSIIAVLMPFILYFFTRKNIFDKFIFSLVITVIIIVTIRFFLLNLDNLSDSLFFRRFVVSYQEYSMGMDISSGRTSLSDLAWKAFETNPIFGIGVGRFISVTHAYTDVHNTYLQTLCEQGIFGFSFYILGVVYSFFHTLKLIRHGSDFSQLPYLKFSFALQVFYILYCFTGNENIGTGQVFYFMAIAIAINAEKQSKFI